MTAGGWRTAEPGPATGTVAWTIDLALSEADLARCDAVLSPEEAARADRFLRPEDRDRYRASHAALRLVLGRALSTDPRALTFRAGPNGKPDLGEARQRALHFNLSHSGARALVGLSTRAPIGVDVEALRPMRDALRVARGHFAADEIGALAGLPADAITPAFFALWTGKEAVVKALGAGLSLPLDRFSIGLRPAEPRLLRFEGGEPEAWTLRHLEPGPGTVGAAAVMAPGEAITCLALSDGWCARLS